MLCSGQIGKLITGRTGDFQEFLILDAVAHNHRQIRRRGSMHPGFITGVKPVGRDKIGILTAQFPGLLSGKTGFTGNAGYCYVGALRREDRTFIVALLACGWPNNKTYKWSDTRTLMNYGLENYYCEDVYEYDREFAPVKVEGAEPENGRLYQEVTVPLKIKEEKIRVLKRLIVYKEPGVYMPEIYDIYGY